MNPQLRRLRQQTAATQSEPSHSINSCEWQAWTCNTQNSLSLLLADTGWVCDGQTTWLFWYSFFSAIAGCSCNLSFSIFQVVKTKKQTILSNIGLCPTDHGHSSKVICKWNMALISGGTSEVTFPTLRYHCVVLHVSFFRSTTNIWCHQNGFGNGGFDIQERYLWTTSVFKNE